MADNLHKLAIQIQGDIDDRFGDSIKDMQNHLKKLDDGVKSISDSKVKTDHISKQFAVMNDESGKAAVELNKLNRQMKQMDGYAAQRKETTAAAQKLRDARNEVRRLEAAQKNSGTKEFTNQIKAAKKEAAAAERAYNKKKTTLTDLDKKLKDAGVDTKNLGEEQKKLAGDIDTASNRVEKLGNEMQKLTKAKYYFSELRGHVKQLGSDLAWVGKTWLKMGAAVGAAGFGLYKISDSVAAAGDAAAKSAAKLQMNTEAFQEMQYAASLSGVKDFSAVMQRFNATVAKAAGGQGEAVKIFKDLGINAKQFAKLNPDKAVMILADKLNKIKDPAKRARAELALFGEKGAEMGSFLKIGSGGMKELMNEARATGLVISEEAAKQAEAFNDARDKMKGTVTGIKNIIGVELIPVFTEMFGELSQFFIDNQEVVKDFAKNLGTKFKEMLPLLKNFAVGAGKMIGVLWDVGKVVVNVVGGVENLGIIIAALPLAKPLLTIGKMIGSLGGLIKSLSGVSGAIGLIGKVLIANPIGLAVTAIAGGAFLIYKYWEPIKEFFSGLWDSIKEKWAAVPAFFAGLWDGAVSLFAGAVDSIKGFFTGVPSAVKTAFVTPFNAARSAITNIIGFFKGDFSGLSASIKNIFGGIKDLIIKPFAGAFDWVSDKWASLKNLFGFGPTVDVKVGEMPGENAPRRGRARGGKQSTPGLIEFAERGPEVAVPAGIADRSHGITSLNIASRSLGFGDVVKPTSMESRLKNVPESAVASHKPISVKAEFKMPEMNFTVYGTEPEEFKRTILDIMREVGASLIPEWTEEIERAAYDTA